MNKSKKLLIPVSAVVLAFAGEYLNMIIYGFLPTFDSGLTNNIIQPVLTWLSTYGLMSAFGLIYYGKDKRFLRFPLAFAFASAVELVLWAVGKLIVGIINSADTGSYAYTAPFNVAAFFVGAAVALVTLLKITKHDGLFFKQASAEEGEIPSPSVRNRFIYGDKAHAVITVLTFGISFFVVRFGTRFGYYLAVQSSSEDMISFKADIVDIVIGLAEILICYLISRGFCGSKKAAFYFLELFLFAEGISAIFDGFSRYIISSVTEALNVSEFYVSGMLYYAPVVIGDITAITVSVFTVKWLISKKEIK